MTPPGEGPPGQHAPTRRAGHTALGKIGLDLGWVVLYDEHEMPLRHQLEGSLVLGQEKRGSPYANKDFLTLSSPRRHRKHAPA